MFRPTRIKKIIRIFVAFGITASMLLAGFPLAQLAKILSEHKIVDSLYLSKTLGNVVDNFGVQTAKANPGTRVRTVEFFAGQDTGSATNDNVGAQNNLAAQTVELAESGADVINAYVELTAEVGGTASLTSTEALIYFDSCTPTPCSPSPAIIMDTAGLGATSAEAQTVRFRANVTAEGTLAAYTGAGADFSFQVGYCFDGASGTDAATCNGTAAANVQGANAKLVVTYTYDDTSATQTNTVIYPLDSGTDIGSKTASQVACTVDSNCPAFSYNAEIPEIGTQLSQFFHLQTSINANTSTDWQTISDIGGNPGGANTSAVFFEEALQHNGGWMNALINGTIAGYANNSAQSLEISTNATAAYVMGGENYITYNYANSAATKTKTTIYPVGEVQTTGSVTKSALTGPTVYFPETGVTIKKAWFRVHTSSSLATSTNLDITHKVGNNSESGIRTYAFAEDAVPVSNSGYFIYIIPSADYAEMALATGTSGKLVQMTADWATARGAVSAELVITYTYTSDTAGYNVSQRLFAGQLTTAATASSVSLGTLDPKIAETSGVTITGASLWMNAKGAAFAAADELLGSNLHATSCTATGSTTVDDITELDSYGFFKDVTSVVTNNDATTYIPCYDTAEVSIPSGRIEIIYKYVPPTLTIGKTAGSVISTKNSGDTGQYAHDTACTSATNCAAFTLLPGNGNASLTSIKISEVGTAAANTDLANGKLYYDTDGNWADAGAETQYGSTIATFDASQTATFSAALTLTSGTTYYFYVGYDLASGTPTYPKGGQTVSFQIAANGDVVSDGDETGAPQTLAGTQTVLPNATSVSYTSGDGGVSGDSITISGKGFGAPTAANRNDCTTATVDYGCVKFTVGGTASVPTSDFTAWSNTSIVFVGSTTLATEGGASAIEVRTANQADATKLTYYFYPKITGTTVCNKATYTPWPADAARQYSSGDSNCPNGLKDGNVQLNGDHFGTAGTITLIGTTTTQAVVGSNCSSSAYTSTCAMVQTPTDIANATYTGSFILTRSSDSKTSTYTGFRILPRIASTGPTNLKGARGDTISFTGDHLCQSGTCPTSNGSSSYATFVGGNVYSGASTWTNTSNPTVVIPGAATDGTTTIVSNTSYSANDLTYDVKFKPDVSSSTGRLPANGATAQSQNLTITGTSFTDGTDGDIHVAANLELARNADPDYSTPEWTRTSGSAETSTTVNTTNGTFANDDAGKTKLECAMAYKWRYRYKDNSAITNAEWSDYSSDFTFQTADCVPDAASLTNVSEGGLTDGARIGQTITLVGTYFATPSNLDTCTAGASNGCIKIGGTGGITIGSSSIICWNNGSGNCAGGTKISFTLPSSITNYGGATTNGLIVYQNGNSDADGLTFYVYPQITSLSVAQAAEGDTITVNGNHFGTAAGANSIKTDGVTTTGCTWSASSLTGCVIPDINDANDSVTIQVWQGTGGNNALSHTSTGFIIMPKVTSISAASFSDGGYQDGTLTINGSHLGSSQGTGNVTINGATQDGTVSWGVSSITSAGIPNGGTDSGNITVTRGDGKTSAASAATFYIYPQITSYTAPLSDGGLQTGTTTVTGNHFGTGGAASNITFNGTTPSSITSWSATSLIGVDIPDAGTDSGTITVTNPQTSKTSNASSTFYIYPSVDSLTVPFAFADAAREYDGGDTDGVITLNGSHFGAAGTMTVLGSNAGTTTTGTCNPAYQATCVGIQIPAAIADTAYTGNIVLTRTSDSKTSTYAGFRVLPRILTNNPTAEVGGNRVQITGNHFCQTGTCPVSPNRSGANDNVKFGSTQGADSDFVNSGASPCSGNSQAWIDTEVCIKVPAATPAGSQTTLVTSNTYTSNTKAFTRSSTVPTDPTSMSQKRLGGDVTLPTGATTNQTTAVMYMTMSTQAPNTTLVPQVEIKPIATAFDGTSVVNGTSVSYVGTPVVGSTTVSSLANLTNYHWRARVQNNATSETSNWANYGGNTENPPTNPAVVDLYIDTSAPNISAVSGTGNDISETITWSTGTSSNSAINHGTSTCVSGSSSTDPASVTSHSIVINNLSPATQYYYRVNSTDSLSNTAYDPAAIASDPADCRTFTTTASVSRLIKTNDFFIFQDTSSGAPSGTTTKSYDVYVAEYNATNTKAVTLKSAYVEVSGIAVASGAFSIAVQVNSQSSIIYNLPSTGGTPAPFSVIYSVTSLNYDYPGDASASNTLYISFPSPPTSISLLNAKQSLTYHYTP